MRKFASGALALLLLASCGRLWADQPSAPGPLPASPSKLDIPAPPKGVTVSAGSDSEPVPIPAAPAQAGQDTGQAPAAPRKAGFPWRETLIAGIGGGIAGGFLGFLNSGDSSGRLSQSLLQQNVPLYGGIGFAAGALMGWILGATAPPPLAPPQAGLTLPDGAVARTACLEPPAQDAVPAAPDLPPVAGPRWSARF